MEQQLQVAEAQSEDDKGDYTSPTSSKTETKQHVLSACSAALEQRYAVSLAHSNGTSLDLSALELSELPPLEELAQRFPRLRQLNIRRNALRLLPEGFARAFPELVTLNVSDNTLEELTAPSIGSLRSLQHLNVARNRIQEFPVATLEKLDALEELDARGNLIEKIVFPNTIDEKLSVGAGLGNLQVLLLADNRLRTIDLTAADTLPKLRVIDLSGNPGLTDAPEKLRRLHERNVLLHSRVKRRELITRALNIRKAVAQALATVPAASPTRVK